MTTTTALQNVAVARSYLGYREGPNNDTIFGAWYGLNHQPWCDMFQSYVAAKSGCADVVGHFAYTPSHLNWFKSRGQFGTTPKVGALVFFNWGGRPPGVPEHVGIVEAVYGPSDILSIEGNSNNVVQRVRRKTNIIGYGYPAYATAAPKPPTPPTPKPPVPHPPQRPVVSLARLQRAAKIDSSPNSPTGHQTYPADVRPVEAALVSLGYLVTVLGRDGSFGTATVHAYSRWQQYCGYRGVDANGIPGMASLQKLGARFHFTVTP